MNALTPHPSHKPTEWPGDGENCRYCRAWSDAEWAKPCPANDEVRARVDQTYAEADAEDEL